MSKKAVSTGNEQLMAEPRNLGCTFTSMKARNIFAIAAAQSVVEGPGVVYNPLYIYGDTGVGKTYLLQVIGNEMEKHNPALKVLYTSGKKFVEHTDKARRDDSLNNLCRQYEKLDALLIDDIEDVAASLDAQQVLSNVIMKMRDDGHQLVVTAKAKPEEIAELDTRLAMRLTFGLITDMI